MIYFLEKRLEQGETLEQAIIREVSEETGFKVENDYIFLKLENRGHHVLIFTLRDRIICGGMDGVLLGRGVYTYTNEGTELLKCKC